MMLIPKGLMLAITFGLAIVLTGCGALFQGTTQNVNIQSSPTGAKIKASPGIGDYTTPTSVELSRKNSYEFTFTKEGYKPATGHVRASAKVGYILLDVFFTGLVGVVVDWATGGWNGLKPEMVIATLEKEDLGSTGPSEIEVKLSMSDDVINIESDSDPVEIHIKALE